MQVITLGLFAILTQHNLSGHLVFVDTLVNHLFHQLLALLHYLLHQLAYSNQLMLRNKNTLGVKKGKANQKLSFKRPTHLISRKAKKSKLFLYIPLYIK